MSDEEPAEQIKQEIYGFRESEDKPYEMDVRIGFYSACIDERFYMESLAAQADKEMYMMKRNHR